jgi:RNA polymerase sigma factor (sigma-70 family)
VRLSDDTDIGGRAERFPATRRSAIEDARSDDLQERERGFEQIVAAYWKPVYKYIRIKFGKSNEDAKDLTQGFFTEAFAKDFFKSYDPGKSRFRTFVRVCLDGFVANEQKAASRIKRGGGLTFMSLDFESAEGELNRADQAPSGGEDYFDREWTRSIFALALERLKAKCTRDRKLTQFQMFERYYLDDTSSLSYQKLSAEFGLPATTVTNHLAFARREFRKLLLEQLRSMTATDDEFRREARALLGDHK